MEETNLEGGAPRAQAVELADREARSLDRVLLHQKIHKKSSRAPNRRSRRMTTCHSDEFPGVRGSSTLHDGETVNCSAATRSGQEDPVSGDCGFYDNRGPDTRRPALLAGSYNHALLCPEFRTDHSVGVGDRREFVQSPKREEEKQMKRLQ